MQYLHDVRNIDLLTYTWPTTFNLIKLKHVKLKHMDQMQEQMPTTKKTDGQTTLRWAVFVAQFVELSPPTPEVYGWNPVFGKHFNWTFTINCIEKTKIKKRGPGLSHFYQ